MPLSEVIVLVATGLFVAAGACWSWRKSLRERDASIADIAWGPGLAGVALVVCLVGGGSPFRKGLIAILALIWGIRLWAHLSRRNSEHGEFPRYRALRKHSGASFGRTSLFTVFGLRAVILWIVSLPIQVAGMAPEPYLYTAFDLCGTALIAIGIFFETVADHQLARFKANSENDGKVLSTGLWRYSRHPNYFGEFLVWCGFFAIALQSPNGVYTIVSPLLMTYLLLAVTGIKQVEHAMIRSKAGYGGYIRRTSPFLPKPPTVTVEDQHARRQAELRAAKVRRARKIAARKAKATRVRSG